MKYTPSPTVKVEKLIPPEISKETILEQISCFRPMREGKFNISLEKKKDKTIIHCYGHGGSGWTTLFGSINKALSLYKKGVQDTRSPIRIIGSGCMGLTAAIELKKLGYNVAGIFTKSLYDLPSWRAAGYFAFVSIKTSDEEQADLNKIGLDTFLTYKKIAEGKHPYLVKKGVNLLPVYCSLDTDSGVEYLEKCGAIPKKERVTLDFGNGVTHLGYVKYMTYFIDTALLMQQLSKQVKKEGIEIKIKEVESFEEIEEVVIFNCCGLGAKELLADGQIVPVKGHLLTLNAPSKSHLNYMIFTKIMQEGKEEYIYFLPKTLSVTPKHVQGTPCTGILGGSFIVNADQLSKKEEKELDKREFKKLLDRTSLFFHGTPFSN